MLFLNPNFIANDKQTTALIEDLYSKLDKRKKGVSNWKAAYGVLAGVLALRAHGTFKVHKDYLSNEQYQIWEAIKDSHLLGYLIQFLGGKGRNEYCVHPKFSIPSCVISINLIKGGKDTPFGYRVTGPGGVSYTSHSAVQHPSQVSLLNGRHAVSCTIKSAQTAVQMCRDYDSPQEIPFPNSYLSLPPYPTDHPCSHEPVGNLVIEMWLDHLRKRLKQYQYVGVIPAHPSCNHDDYNTIPIVLLADHAHEFTDWAYQVSLDFWRLHKLKAVTFPLHIHHKDWTQIIRGQPVQILREKIAGVVA